VQVPVQWWGTTKELTDDSTEEDEGDQAFETAGTAPAPHVRAVPPAPSATPISADARRQGAAPHSSRHVRDDARRAPDRARSPRAAHAAVAPSARALVPPRHGEGRLQADALQCAAGPHPPHGRGEGPPRARARDPGVRDPPGEAAERALAPRRP